MAAVLGKAEAFAMGMPSNTTRRTVWVGEQSLAATLAASAAPGHGNGTDGGQDDGGQDDGQNGTATAQTTTTSTTAATTSTGTLPAFLNYAIISNGKVEMDEVAIRSAGAWNANVHANDELKVGDDDAEVSGFGTSANKISGDPGYVFNPISNPDNRQAYGNADAVSMQRFDASDFASLASRSSDGNVRLRNDLTLGTEDDPVFLYVDGDLRIDDDIKISGYGAIFVHGKIDIRGDVESDSPGQVGLFATEELQMRSRLTIEASLVSGKTIELSRDVSITGSVAAYDEVKMDRDVRLEFAPLAESIARKFW
jgi:hypothetical protein